MCPTLTIVGLNFAPECTGTAPYTTQLASHLVKTGWEVKVVTGYPHYPEWRIRDGYAGRTREELIDGVRVLRLRHHVPAKPKLLNRLVMEMHFGLRAAVADWGTPDVLLLVSPALLSTGTCTLAARLRYPNTPTVLWVQDIYTRGIEETRAAGKKLVTAMRRTESWILSQPTTTVVIHERFKQYLSKKLGLSEERVTVVRNWSHLGPPHKSDRTTSRAKLGWDPSDIVVLHAGNMGAKQYLENVIAAAKYADMHHSRVRFVLLGDGNQRPRLEEIARGVARLQFLSPLPDDEYSSALAAADVLLVNEKPGVRDMSVPSKLTSYFATGRPVLAAVEENSTTADEINASKAGLIVPSGDPESLVGAAEQLGMNPVEAKRLGDNGRRYAENVLSTEAAMYQWEDALTALTRG